MSPTDTPEYRFRLYIWKPKVRLDIQDQWTLQESFYVNGVNGQFPGTDKGKHWVMGHCMVAVEKDGVGILPDQLCFGKTSPDGPVEEAWARAMRLDWSKAWQVIYGLYTIVTGRCPRFRTPLSPPGGVQTLFRMRNPSRYETRGELEMNVDEADGNFSYPITEEQALHVLRWINDSPCRQLGDPRGPGYGFSNACCDWAVAAAESIGIVDFGAKTPVRTRLYIHREYWASPGEMNEKAWSTAQGGEYNQYVDIITPILLIEAFENQPGWASEPIVV